MKLSFHGAARSVTGSCHLIEWHGRKLLIDCGMVQGERSMGDHNAESFGFDPAEIDWVLLTHAHLDHCGRLPLLARRGFRGEIIATAATRELTRLVLLDAAHLQEEEARRHARHKHRGDSAGGDPLYTLIDALGLMDRFGQPARYGVALELAPGLSATFVEAGHILGSASVLVEAEGHGGRKSIVFSGDIGNAGRPVLRPPAAPDRADAVVMESTYGDRCHRPIDQSVDELYGAISDCLKRGGNVVIPAFALERSQEVLYYLRMGIETGRLPASLQLFLDSPMAISATEIFARHADCLSADLARRLRGGDDPFEFAGLHRVREAADSMAINRITGGVAIMAGSGMCTGGRVMHHLRHNLWRREAAVIFTGFAAAGTLGRAIIDGARKVRLFGEDVEVNARIHTINGFSAHAGQSELAEWRRSIAGAGTTFLVHGEEKAMQGLAPLIPGSVAMPQLHEEVDI